ncbi:uncharacterized protein LOC113291436 [Papaver somniferum]|uniref:uncharacterized protein LOC113291436 n=1 Tax=Papaver somniferum TaxID=3469 RepID=UPI000E6FB588|nr:uncharacterized protein LOC113291436 [Papaver somniferum]
MRKSDSDFKEFHLSAFARSGPAVSGIRPEEKEGIIVLSCYTQNDTLVFLDAKEEEVENLLIILQIFEAMTGLKVNLSKSSTLSVGADDKIQEMAEILNCGIEQLPLKYLGLQVGANSRNASIWDVVIEKFQKKLALWKRRFFTKAGRVTLIKSTLSSLPIYFLSIFTMPAKVEQKLTQIMRAFIWGSSIEKRKINWI